MFDLLSGNPMVQMMDRSMTLASRRMGLIASNLANIDTPSYKTRDFDFKAAFRHEMEKLDRQFSPTGSFTSPAGPVDVPLATDPVAQSYERNDGNDVNLDRETMLLAQTQATYQLSSSFAQADLRRLLNAIRDAAR